MEDKERISLYLSGRADTNAELQTEDALLRAPGFLESFMEAVEQRLYTAPPGLAGAVMRLLPSTPTVTVPVLSRKLCAAVCFCSAAAILVFSISGADRHVVDFITAQTGKLNEWIAYAQNLTLGGYYQ